MGKTPLLVFLAFFCLATQALANDWFYNPNHLRTYDLKALNTKIDYILNNHIFATIDKGPKINKNIYPESPFRDRFNGIATRIFGSTQVFHLHGCPKPGCLPGGALNGVIEIDPAMVKKIDREFSAKDSEALENFTITHELAHYIQVWYYASPANHGGNLPPAFGEGMLPKGPSPAQKTDLFSLSHGEVDMIAIMLLRRLYLSTKGFNLFYKHYVTYPDDVTHRDVLIRNFMVNATLRGEAPETH